MLEFIRRFKISYLIYNFFHKKELYHNEINYKKIGINKKYFSSVSSKDFKHLQNSNLENYSLNIEALKNNKLFKTLSISDQESLLNYEKNGFAILQKFVSDNIIDDINNSIDKGIENGTFKFVNHNKIMFALHKINSLYNVGANENLHELLSVLMNGNAVLFQSINFKMGSEQHTHSDSIHMTTFPLGGLLGVWIALEDIDEENGPLHYYPGSHKLPYYMNKDYDNEGNKFMLGEKDYSEYEKMMQEKIKEHQLQKQIFKAKKGDVLIWHANLFHGGEPHTNKNKTRKSVVFHYFKEGCICYHEITQRPALLK